MSTDTYRRRRFFGRKAASQMCSGCNERVYLHSWRETDVDPAGRRSVRTYVYFHPSTGFIDAEDAAGRVHLAPEAL